jgi:hypothetical protein
VFVTATALVLEQQGRALQEAQVLALQILMAEAVVAVLAV